MAKVNGPLFSYAVGRYNYLGLINVLWGGGHACVWLPTLDPKNQTLIRNRQVLRVSLSVESPNKANVMGYYQVPSYIPIHVLTLSRT